MRVLFAIIIFASIAAVGIGMLRSLGGGSSPGGSKVLPEVELVPPDVRIMFWCENCLTELLLIRKGSDASPRHCGETMIRREEVARN